MKTSFLYHCKNYLVKMITSAVSGFIEKVGNVIKGIPKHNYHRSTPGSFKELAQTIYMHPPACWLLSGSEPNNSQQIDGMYWLAEKCLC